MEYSSSLPPPLFSRRWLLLSLAALLGYLLLCITLDRIFPAPSAVAIASLSFPRPRGELGSTPLAPAPSAVAIASLSFPRPRGELGSTPLAPVPSSPAPQVSRVAVTANFPGNGSGGESAEDKCNLFEGRWVHDPRRYPLYSSQRCPFLSDQVSCQRSGRPDSDYERWRWQPNGCDMPRFNGTETLERWRGKRVVVVGDSLNRNMWESMICMLYSAVRRKRVYAKTRSADYKLFRALDYDCTVEFFWSPFLVELKEREGDRAKILHLDNLSASARSWRGADVIVFNTGHWWTHIGKMRAWDYFQRREEVTEEMDPAEAFNRALRTWASWVDRNVDPRRTAVFFRSISPEHKRENLQWCYNQTRPITDKERYVWRFPKSMVTLVERTLRRMRTPVRYLNVTRLSEFRRDAHTGVYTSRKGKLLTPEQRREPERFADCSHWCLPGLPDTWNELLFASLLETTFTASRTEAGGSPSLTLFSLLFLLPITIFLLPTTAASPFFLFIAAAQVSPSSSPSTPTCSSQFLRPPSLLLSAVTVGALHCRPLPIQAATSLVSICRRYCCRCLPLQIACRVGGLPSSILIIYSLSQLQWLNLVDHLPYIATNDHGHCASVFRSVDRSVSSYNRYALISNRLWVVVLIFPNRL